MYRTHTSNGFFVNYHLLLPTRLQFYSSQDENLGARRHKIYIYSTLIQPSHLEAPGRGGKHQILDYVIAAPPPFLARTLDERLRLGETLHEPKPVLHRQRLPVGAQLVGFPRHTRQESSKRSISTSTAEGSLQK